MGFEPTKALPPELKSGPFDHSGTPAASGRTNLVLNRAALICPENRCICGTYDENSLTPCEQPGSVKVTRNARRGLKTARIALFLTFLMLTPLYSSQVSNLELDESPISSNTEETIELYTLYLASADSTTDGDGLITTQIPDSGGQETASALDETIEFISSIALFVSLALINHILLFLSCFFIELVIVHTPSLKIAKSVQISSTSFKLCVLSIIVLPSDFKRLIILTISCIPFGSRPLLGSSNTTISSCGCLNFTTVSYTHLTLPTKRIV